MKRIRVRSILIYIILSMIAFVFLFPFIVMLGGSLNKMSILVSTPSMWIPTEPTLRNYISIFKESLVLRWFLNSVTISLIPMLTTIFICSAAGYIFAKKIFRGKQIFFWVFMAILMVPSQMTLIPRYIMYSQFNWIDTYWSFLIPGIWSVMFMFLMRQFISTIPDSLLDSANIDGCGDFRIYAEIILPLSKAALATVATLTFINKWNDFINPLIYTSNDSMYNMIAGLTSMLQRIPNFGIQMASAIVTFVPILLIFIFFQKYFTEGIVLAGIKG